MAKTRAMRKMSVSRKRSYAKRVRSSPCRSKGPAVCRSMKNCKYTKGKKRSFCRKATNSKRTRAMSGGKRRRRRTSKKMRRPKRKSARRSMRMRRRRGGSSCGTSNALTPAQYTQQ